MAVAVDATSTSGAIEFLTDISWNHVCSGSDRVLDVTLAADTGNSGLYDLVTVTYNGIACTNVVSATAGLAQAAIYRLVAPATGTNSVRVLSAGPIQFGFGKFGAISFTGVDQTTPEYATASHYDSSGSAPTPLDLSISTPAGSIALDCAFIRNGASGGYTALHSATNWLNQPDGFGAFGNALSSYLTDATALGYSFTTSAGDYWGHVALSLNPVATGIFLRPDGTSSAGRWFTQAGGSDLHNSIDETVADDADYIQSGFAPAVDICKISLSNDASAATNATIRYRYKKVELGAGETINLRVRLLEGSTVIASQTVSGITTSYVDGTLQLTFTEFASIVDRTNLYLEFTANP